MATEIKLGPDGPNYAAEKMGLTVSRISNAYGAAAQVPTGEVSLRTPGMVGVPATPPVAKKEKALFIPNMLRLAVEEKWGHPYGYWDALAANDLDERHVLYKGQPITIPARAKRAKMGQAEKWRRRFGND
jgi:hypothetical protein